MYRDGNQISWSRRQLINSDLTRSLGSNRIVLFLSWDGGYTSIYIFIKVLNVYISSIICNYTSKFLLFSASQNFVSNFSLLYSLFYSSEMQMTLGVKENEDSSYKPIFSSLPETNILNVVRQEKNCFVCLSTELEPFSFLLSDFQTKSLVFHHGISSV